MLQQSKVRLQTQLKRLVNGDLKEICRAYNKAVSGNKAELQQRCLEGELVDDFGGGVVTATIAN